MTSSHCHIKISNKKNPFLRFSSKNIHEEYILNQKPLFNIVTTTKQLSSYKQLAKMSKI